MMNKKMTKGIQENNFIKLFKILFIITLFFPIVIFGKAKELNIDTSIMKLILDTRNSHDN